MSWRPAHSRCGVAIYNFDARQPHELSLEVGDVVCMTEECVGAGWYKGYCVKNISRVGIFPCSYVHLRNGTSSDENTAGQSGVATDEPLAAEVADVLRVWGDSLKDAYIGLKEDVVQKLNSSMTLLVKWRRDILLGSMRSDHVLRLKAKIAGMINKCNTELGLDVVPRDENYDAVHVDSVSVLDLYNIHAQHRKNDGMESTSRFVHLYASLSSASCQVPGEDTDLFFSLYDSTKQEFISERMAVRYLADGSLHDTGNGKNPSHSWLFTDLDSSMLDQFPELFIICHVVRLGRMDMSVKKPTTSIFRRPVGCVVLPLAKLRAVVNEPATMVQVSSYMYTVADEKDFSVLHDHAIRRLIKPSERSSASLNLQLIYGDLGSALDSNPGLLSKETFLVRKLGFAAYTLPGEVRNDIFVTLDRGEFEKGSKSSAKNVEVTVNLMNMNGAPMDMMVQASASPPTSELQSVIMYHNNTPRWGEPFRLNIPLHLISEAVLAFNIRHCSSTSDSRADKQSVFAYLRLVKTDGTTIQNGLQELCVYRYSNSCLHPPVFMSVPSTLEELAQMGSPTALSLSKKESFSVITQVCSTKLTQDPRLLALLQWRMHQDQLVEVLEGLMHMDGRGVCLFMHDAMDALFNILDIDNKLCTQLVFNALVHFLNFLLQPEYEQFVETLEKYISVHFSGAMAYKKLLTGLRGYIDNAHRPEFREPLLHTVQCFHFVFKIITQSRHLHVRAAKAQGTLAPFRESVEKMTRALISLIQSNDASLHHIQCAALKSLSNSIDMFRTAFCSGDLAALLSSAVDAIPADEPNHRLLESKLAYMLVLTSNSLFDSADARRTLLPIMLVHTSAHLASGMHIESVLRLIGKIVTRLESKSCHAEHDDKRQLADLLPQLVAYFSTHISGSGDGSLDDKAYMVICSLLGILRLMESDVYGELMPTLPSTSDFVQELFNIFWFLLTVDVFDRSWTSLRLIVHNIVLVSISSLAEILRPDAGGCSPELMMQYFMLATTFVTQPVLQLELLHPIRANQVRARFGDMRFVMATELVLMWSILSEDRNTYVPTLPKPLLSAALVQQDEVRRAVLPLFIDLLELDYAMHGSIDAVSADLLGSLEPVICAGAGDYEFLSLAEEIWLGNVANSTTLSEEASSLICNLVNRIVPLGIMLIDYRLLGETDRTSADRHKRMLALYNLLSFYQQHGPHNLHQAALCQLARLHILEESWTEAAFTLLRVSESLDFGDHTMLEGVLKYPRQPAASRKEALTESIVEFFGKGKAFEDGIEQCDTLISLYRHQTFNYSKLRSVLSVQASYFGSIVDDLRPAREYFRVGYYGQGFPHFLQNRTFVYRGEEYEKLTSFQERVLMDHGNVELMKTNEAPGEDITSSDRGYLQICTVKPCPRVPPQFETEAVNGRIREYHESNNVTQFEYSRPFHKGPKDKDNEFKSLWLERTTLTVAWALPGILAWSEVLDTKVSLVSPIDNGVETMVAKNKQLQSMIASYRANSGANINPLSMALNGVIDAAVMGGTENYEKAFFVTSYLQENPDDAGQVELLKKLMVEQVGILEQGLRVHHALAPENLKPFHEKMEASFAQMKEKMLLKYGSFTKNAGDVNNARSVSVDADKPVPRARPRKTTPDGNFASSVSPTPGPKPLTTRFSSVRTSHPAAVGGLERMLGQRVAAARFYTTKSPPPVAKPQVRTDRMRKTVHGRLTSLSHSRRNVPGE